MLSSLRSRRSAVTFDLGAAGIRAYQVQQRGGRLRLCDSLDLERATAAADNESPAAPELDTAQLSRLIGQGNFAGDDVTLVVSAPEAQFLPLRLPEQALLQPPDRIEQALKFEVARESRCSADNLELRYWKLPPGHSQKANVMVVVLPSKTTLDWWDGLASRRLNLRRIDVSPCALVRLARQLWTPANTDLWGVLDLGLRHSTLTTVLGTIPTYIRSLTGSAHEWTQRLASAFEVSYAVAEQLKREHGVNSTPAGLRSTGTAGAALRACDLASALSGVLRDALQTLSQEINRCFAYVLQSYPDCNVRRLVLTGGGAALRGLGPLLEKELEVPVCVLSAGEAATSPPWERPLPTPRLDPRAAAAVGAALLDLEAA